MRPCAGTLHALYRSLYSPPLPVAAVDGSTSHTRTMLLLLQHQAYDLPFQDEFRLSTAQYDA